MKIKTFKQLNESSEYEFLSHYSEEIQNSIELLKKLRKLSLTSDDNTIDDEKNDKIDNRLSVYDTNVPSKIEDWIYDTPTSEEIARFAISNEDRWGTEPQMVLNAIEDYANICNIYIDHEDEDEDEDILEN